MTFRMAVFAALFMTTPALADDTCFAAPTRACLFELAMETALAEDDPRKVTVDLLSIALSQYAAGDDGTGETIRQMIGILQAAETKPGEAFAALDWAVLSMGDLLAAAPGPALLMARVLDGKDAIVLTPPDDSAKVTKAALRAYALAGSPADIERLIGSADGVLQGDLIMTAADALMKRGDFPAAYALDDGRDVARRATLDETAVIMLLRQGNLDGAALAAAMTTNEATRTAALVKVALAYARAGSLKAKAIAARITPPKGDRRAAYVTLNLAEIFGHIGDSEKATALLDQIEPEIIPPRIIEAVRLIVALKSGDMLAALAIINEAEPDDAAIALTGIGDMLVGLNPLDRDHFLASLVSAHKARALTSIAREQLAQGDIAAAEATIADLSALGAEGILAKHLKVALAKSLMTVGEVTKAMDVAKDSQDARLFGELAAMLN